MARAKIDPLDWRTPIVDPQTGLPTPQFMRLWQSIFGNEEINAGDIANNASGLAEKANASVQIIAGDGLSGGGDLTTDRTIDLDAVLDDLTDVDVSTVPPTNNQVLSFRSSDSLWVPRTVSGGGGGGMVLIEEYVGDGSANSHTFSAISDEYRTLRLEWLARTTAAATAANLTVQINGDSGSNYDRHLMVATGSGTASGNAAAGGTNAIIGAATGSTGPTDVAATGFIEFPFYTETVYQKTGQGLHHSKTANAIANLSTRVTEIWWRNTAAITSLTVAVDNGNFATDAKIQLYGIP